MNSAPVIECRSLWKIFGDRANNAMRAKSDQGLGKLEIRDRFQCVVGVVDASFSVNEGEIFCIMGLSGSGKSTLLAALAALGQGGYMEAVWDLTATYSGGLTDLVPTVDALIGMRITEIGDDHSIGSDVLVNELTLDIMEFTRGGLSATAGGSSLAGVGASIGGILGGNL